MPYEGGRHSSEGDNQKEFGLSLKTVSPKESSLPPVQGGITVEDPGEGSQPLSFFFFDVDHLKSLY